MKKFGKKVVLALALAVSLGVGAGSTAEAATKAVKSVKVADPVTGSTKTVYLAKGKSKTLKTTVTVTKSKYNKSKYKKLTFKTNKKSVATVNSKGKVTGKKAGKAKITVTSKYNKKKKTITVQVFKGKVTKVSLNKKSLALNLGGTATLKSTVKASKGAKKTVKWTTSNSKVATVSSKGKVTAKGVGTAKIKVTAVDGTKKSATCTVTVKPIDVTTVTVDKNAVSVVEGASATVTATVAPANATVKTLTVKSSNEAVAKAAVSGSTVTITGVKAGSADITVQSNNGKTATVKVTVTAKDVPVVPDKKYVTVITPAEDKEVDVEVVFDGENAKAAAASVEDLLLKATKNGDTKAVKVNGDSYTVKNDNNKIVVINANSAAKELSDIVGKDAKVTFTYSAKLATAVKALDAKDFAGDYNYSIKIDGNAVSNMEVKADGTITATAIGKSYTATVKDGKIYVEGDITTDAGVVYLTGKGYATAEKIEQN